MCDATEWGVQLCQEAVCSDRGGECSPIVVERLGRLAVPLVCTNRSPSSGDNSYVLCLGRELTLFP